MSPQTYQQEILRGIEGLPDEVLAEIADFILFVRERRNGAQVALSQLSQAQEAHLEVEFADYERLYPLEHVRIVENGVNVGMKRRPQFISAALSALRFVIVD